MQHTTTPSDDEVDCTCGDCSACIQREAAFQMEQDDQIERDFIHRQNEAEEAAFQRQLDGAPSDDDDDGDEEDPHGAHPY